MSNNVDNTYQLDGPATARVRLPTGSCVVTVGPEQQVTASVRPATPGRAADERAAAGTEITFADAELSVVVPQSRSLRLWGVQTGYVVVSIGLPPGSALDVDTDSGSLEVRGTLAALSAVVSSGSLKADEITGDVGIDCSSGKVTIGRSGTRADIKVSSGGVRIDESAGALRCEISSGKTVLGAVSGDLEITSSSGKIQIGAAGPGTIQVHSSSGAVTVGVAAGVGVETDLSTGSGKIRGDLAKGVPAGDGGLLRLAVDTSSGSIEVSRV
jgi:Putative adhesin